MRRALVAALAVGALAACSGGGSSSTHAMTGTVRTHTGQTARLGASGCSASGVDDIAAAGGATVTVKDGAGKTVGVATLAAGGDGGTTKVNGATVGVCTFAFTVAKIPETAFYEFDVAGHPAMARFSLEQMRAAGWSAVVDVGNA